MPNERAMPHVIVKPQPGRSEQRKARVDERITEAVTGLLGDEEESVSVAIDEHRTIKTPLRPWCT
jgi:phenylpyruvate tautomerase PptA (4-oxalocrotonate tautomerase family)